MEIRTGQPHEREQLLALMDACLRRAGSPSGPRDDFPLALGTGNHEGQIVLTEDGQIRAGLACLVRSFHTSAGEIPVAAIGSVFTAPAHRGRGLSRLLQAEVLERLREQGVPLAVLWSDRPELYARRGFAPAGIEYQVDLDGWRGETVPSGAAVRAYRAQDEGAVSSMHATHPYRTCRRPGEAAILYAMPGTRGVVLEPSRGAAPTAYAFCGKGQDFPGWVLEWGGVPHHVLALVTHLRATARARWLLAPQGAESLAARLAAGGAQVHAAASGLWCVLAAPRLAAAVGSASSSVDPCFWLGGVDAGGLPRLGVLQLAVWGFDSV